MGPGQARVVQGGAREERGRPGASAPPGAAGPPPEPAALPPGTAHTQPGPAAAAAAPALSGRGAAEARHDYRDSPRHRAAPERIPRARRGPGPLQALTPSTRAAREPGNRPDTGTAQPRSRQLPPARAPR